jgi:serine protease AprX
MYRSLRTVKADVARTEFGVTGRGLVWAVIATGVDGRHPHFAESRNTDLPAPLRHLDYSGLYEAAHADEAASQREEDDFILQEQFTVDVPVDGHGIGTAVAGIIAGQSTDADGNVLRGFTSEAKILSVNLFERDGNASEFNLIAALKAIQLYNLRAGRTVVHGVVLPVSFRRDVRNYACGHSPICVEVDRLVNSGVVVVASVGNTSFDAKDERIIEGGITDPGNAELAITVGATHSTAPELYGPSYFSARGPTADGRPKPDLLAPGERTRVVTPLKSSVATGTTAKRRTRTSSRNSHPTAQDVATQPYAQALDGTEIAAAHVAGAAAALMSIEPTLIGKPLDLKGLLLRTAVDLRRDPLYQGHGMLDLLAAGRAATGTARSVERVPTVSLFCSYSHRDQKFWKEFNAHLAPMQRAGLIEVWSDLLLEAGQRWEKEIYARLDKADIVLLLVSSNFFQSDFCYSKEFTRALQREADGAARIIPVLVRPVSLKGTVLAEIQALPPEARPISAFGDPHKGWAQVADHLFTIVEKLVEKKRGGSAPPL